MLSLRLTYKSAIAILKRLLTRKINEKSQANIFAWLSFLSEDLNFCSLGSFLKRTAEPKRRQVFAADSLKSASLIELFYLDIQTNLRPD